MKVKKTSKSISFFWGEVKSSRYKYELSLCFHGSPPRFRFKHYNYKWMTGFRWVLYNINIEFKHEKY